MGIFRLYLDKIKNLFKENWIAYISFVFVFGYLIFVLLIPFLRYNQLVNWDMTGLYFSSWYEKNFLFPRVIGWNPFFFLGYPQHQFYNPLFAYMTAALAYLIPLFWSFKTLFAITVIILPISFYYCVRSFGFSKNKAAVTMSMMFAILFIFPTEGFGGNMHASFNVGLIGHALGVALFFFYLGMIERDFGKRYLMLSFLFALIVLTHIIAAFATAFLLVAYLLSKEINKKNIIWFVKHWFMTILLCAFWTIPFIAKRAWLGANPIGGPESIFIYIVAFIFLLLIFFKKHDRLLPLVLFLVLVLFFSFVTMYVAPLPIHLYRFMMYLYLITPILFMLVIKRDNMPFYFLVLVASILIVLLSAPIAPQGEPIMQTDQQIQNLSKDSRLFIIATLNMETTPHLLQHQIPIEYDVHAIRGLYVESSKNAKYIFYLEQEIEPTDSFVWGTSLENATITTNNANAINRIRYQFNLFNIDKMMVPKKNISNYKNVQNLTYWVNYSEDIITNYIYYIYNTGNSSIIEILNYTPSFVRGDWEKEMGRWFLSDNITQGVLVNEKVPGLVGSGKESIVIENISRTGEYMRFRINNASHEVPVLIKVSNFPNWHAYENGKEIKIYQASPYIMLVYAQGEVELRYQNNFVDTFSNTLSILGVIILIVLGLYSWKEAVKKD